KQPIHGFIHYNTVLMNKVCLTKSHADEIAQYNVLIHTIGPGRMATERAFAIDSIKANKLGISSEEVAAQSKNAIPLARYGTPEEFAKVVTFFVSDACTYMTGSSVLVDGGMVRAI
nr:SDR family oxidoreductase [Desulfitobacterium hafniense]